MTNDEIDTMIRRMILEEQARHVTPEALTQAKTDAINILAHLLVAAAPEAFEKKISLAPKHTNTHVFELPSDNLGLKAVWDYDDDAADISGAADNGSGLIRITHNGTFEDEDRVNVHGVTGTTEANGIWEIDYVDSTHFDLVGSAFVNAYVSGGRVFKEEDDTYKYPITRRPSKFQTAASETQFFYREDDIVVDDYEFENDIIILYRYLPSDLTEIPSRMHSGIYAYGALMLMHIPPRNYKVGNEFVEHPQFNTLKKNQAVCTDMWNRVQAMAATYSPIMGSNNISTQKAVQKWL